MIMVRNTGQPARRTDPPGTDPPGTDPPGTDPPGTDDLPGTDPPGTCAGIYPARGSRLITSRAVPMASQAKAMAQTR
jgi:hypothetical protein